MMYIVWRHCPEDGPQPPHVVEGLKAAKDHARTWLRTKNLHNEFRGDDGSLTYSRVLRRDEIIELYHMDPWFESEFRKLERKVCIEPFTMPKRMGELFKLVAHLLDFINHEPTTLYQGETVWRIEGRCDVAGHLPAQVFERRTEAMDYLKELLDLKSLNKIHFKSTETDGLAFRRKLTHRSKKTLLPTHTLWDQEVWRRVTIEKVVVPRTKTELIRFMNSMTVPTGGN